MRRDLLRELTESSAAADQEVTALRETIEQTQSEIALDLAWWHELMTDLDSLESRVKGFADDVRARVSGTEPAGIGNTGPNPETTLWVPGSGDWRDVHPT